MKLKLLLKARLIVFVRLVDDIVTIRYVLPTRLQIVKGEINFFC